MSDKSRLKILQVCSARKLVYGAAHSLMTLSSAQRENGNVVEFLAFKGRAFANQVRERGFTVHEVPVRFKIDPLAILRIRKIVQQGGFDIVHTHLSTSSVNGCLAARLAGVKAVSTVHGMSSKHSYFAADHLIAVSDQVKEYLKAQGIADSRISVVYNGLDNVGDAPDRATARQKLGIPADAIVLGTVARLSAMKGVDDAIRAVALLAPQFPNLTYLVIGDGDELENCRALASELGVIERVRFEGYRPEVRTYLAAMDVFLFPSLREAMGIALVEAMAAGLPSVATDVDGIPEVLSESCGLLVPARAPDQIAVAATRLLSDERLRTEMSANARRRAQEVFSATAMERSTDWVYREVLGLGLRVPAGDPNATHTRQGV